MRIKPGVTLYGLKPQLVLAALIVEQVMGDEAVITSGSDGKHSEASLHYSGSALDFRTRHLEPTDRAWVANEVRERLGGDFDVVLEKDHLHVEYQPKLSTREGSA